MIEAIQQLLEHTPLLALFGAIGLGYALGRISVGGLSLGVGAVLFAGLALGALAPGSTPPAMVGSIGLLMFLYGVGIQYGEKFFAGLAGSGLKWNLLSAVGTLAALGVALGLGSALGLAPEHSVGLFAGGLTSTPALQAAIDAAGNGDPAIGYSVAYPVGVIGPILCLFVFGRVVKTRIAAAPAALQPLELTLGEHAGNSVAELLSRLPQGVDLMAVRRGGSNQLPDPRSPLAQGDAVLLIGLPDALEQARLALGHAEPGRLAGDRRALDLLRLFVSRPDLVGTRVGDCTFRDGIAAKIAEIRRGDVLLFPSPDIVLEHGDRVGVLASRETLPVLRRYFGDSLKATAEFSYISVGLGMSLGVLLGLIPIPLPGLGRFTLGIAGGPLVVALVLGRLGRTGPLSWRMPLAANLTLRNFGLTLFLAAVGLGAGKPFVDTVASMGFALVAVGAAIIVVSIAGLMLAGHLLLRLDSDDLFGVVSGTTGNPAILAYANRAMASDRIDVAYATTFPAMTILKILCAQVTLGLLSSG